MAKAQTDCEEVLIVIVQEERVVDEQQKMVNAETLALPLPLTLTLPLTLAQPYP